MVQVAVSSIEYDSSQVDPSLNVPSEFKLLKWSEVVKRKRNKKILNKVSGLNGLKFMVNQ